MPLTSLRHTITQLTGLLLAGLLLFVAPTAFAGDTDPSSPIMVPNPGADLWRAVRQRDGVHLTGQTQVRGVETGVLITQTGEEFRNYRRNDFIGNAGLVIAAAAGVILLFYLIRGRMRIPGGRSGKRIKRFEDFDRTVHWLVAILFIFLALTGLILLFGRFIVLPVFGAEAFGLIASACKEGHNLFGPVFLVSLVLLFLRFVAKNLPARGDLKWLLKGGGMIGKGHVSAGYFNAGEKAWFWGVTVLGLTVSLTGLVLIFPILGQGREVMQLALIVHGLAAVLFIAGSFGHIYIGTLGMEGSLESMTTGYVDEHWAEAHHDRWYAEVKGLSDPTDTGTSDRAASGGLHPTPDKA